MDPPKITVSVNIGLVLLSVWLYSKFWDLSGLTYYFGNHFWDTILIGGVIFLILHTGLKKS